MEGDDGRGRRPRLHLDHEAIVAANVTAAREVRKWNFADLSREVEKRGYPMDRRAVERLEKGVTKKISVDDLVALGLALGVAPLVLLCPPAGVRIAADDRAPMRDNYSLLGIPPVDEDEDEDEDKWLDVSGAILVHGPWERDWGPRPDESVSAGLRAVKQWERDLWDEAKNVAVPMSPAQAAAFKAKRSAWRRKDRWVARLVPTLPPAVQRKLAAAGGDWFDSEIKGGWFLPAWSDEQLRKRLKDNGLSAR